MSDAADNRLPALIHRDVLHRDLLLSPSPVPPERFDLCREGAGQLVEGAFGTVLLVDRIDVGESAGDVCLVIEDSAAARNDLKG